MAKDIKKLILGRLLRKKRLKVADIVRATGFSRAYINRFFQELKNNKKIVLMGKANKAHYVLAKEAGKSKKKVLSVKRILKNIDLLESNVLDEIKKDSGIFSNLSKNVSSILDYTFTEMLNNAIEHSQTKEIVVLIEKKKTSIKFKVVDFGIGIFNNIMKKKKLKNKLEAIQDLTKGKQTTAPREHSGEGIFFTSKVGDKLVICGSNKKIIFDNLLNDIFVSDINQIKGTRVEFEISINSKRDLIKVFKQYSSKGFGFSKTKVVVDLYKIDSIYISRSQARRVLAGLEKFKTIMLDFKDVETIGQGFADEVFRVWQNHHPKIKINYQNANKNVIFMIERSKKRIE